MKQKIANGISSKESRETNKKRHTENRGYGSKAG